MDNLIIFLAKYLIFIFVLLAAIALFQVKAKLRVQLIFAIIIAGMLALIISRVAARLYYHPRPFIANGTTPLVPHGNDNGFPSDHTLLAATLSAAVYYYYRRGAVLLFVIATLIGLGRVLAEVHWPVDILASLVIGAISGWIGYYLAIKLRPSSEQPAIEQKHN